jgi:hypothetical protein
MKALIFTLLIASSFFAQAEIVTVTKEKVVKDLYSNQAVLGALTQGQSMIAGVCSTLEVFELTSLEGQAKFKAMSVCTDLDPDGESAVVITVEGSVWSAEMEAFVDVIRFNFAG